MSLGGSLRRARERRGLTTRALGARLGISHATLVRREREEAGCTLAEVTRWAAALGVRVVVLDEQHGTAEE